MSTFSGADFTFPEDLPPVTFAKSDPDEVLARLVKNYETITGKTLYPGDPERLFFHADAYELSVAYGLLDFTGKMNLLAYAQGDFLDQIGAWHGVTRLGSSPARVTQRFSAEPGLAFAVPIPETLRVSPDNEFFFKVTEAASIPAASSPTDSPYVDVTMECMTAGDAGNGFVPGQIRVLVDPQPYVASVVNVDTSAGGSDTESDDHFRLRIYLAPESFSVAGPEGAYQFWTYSASPLIADVAVESPLPCEIEVYPMLANGEIPNAALLDLVAETLSPRDRRPLGDRVSVLAPNEVFYEISATYYVSKEDAGAIASIQEAVLAAGEAYAVWQRSKLGRDIVPDALVSMVRDAGAKRLVVENPVFTVIPRNAVARASTIHLVFGGFEDA